MQVGPYQVVRELGRGAMGVVYEGRSGAERVALKVLLGELSEQDLRRFQREAEACAQLRHPNLVGFRGAGSSQGRPYLVLEFLEGPTLAERLRQGPLETSAACALVASLARGLGAAHALGVLHRDVKPENVILVGGERPVLTDFGLARVEGRALERLTKTGEVLGTPSYMAPEQADGDPRQIDARTDVYGLGALLYVVLTGRPPFAEGTVFGTLKKVLSAPPAPLRELRAELPLELERVCLRCLEKDPGERYSSAFELAAALEGLQRGDSGRVGAQRSLLPFGALGAALLLAGAALAGWSLRGLSGSGGSAAPSSPSPSASPAPSPSASPEPSPSASPEVRPEELLAKARARIQVGDLEAAERLLEEASSSAQRPAWLAERGYLCFVRSEYEEPARWREEAQAALEQARSTLPSEASGLRQRVLALLSYLGRAGAAEEALALGRSPGVELDPLALAACLRERRGALYREREAAQAQAAQRGDVSAFVAAGAAQARALAALATFVESLAPEASAVELEITRSDVALDQYLAPVYGVSRFVPNLRQGTPGLASLAGLASLEPEHLAHALARARGAQALAPGRVVGHTAEARAFKLSYQEASQGALYLRALARSLGLAREEARVNALLQRHQALELYAASYAAFSKALQIAPRDGRTYLDRAYLQTILAEGREERLAGALEDCARAVALEPKDAHFQNTQRVIAQSVASQRAQLRR